MIINDPNGTPVQVTSDKRLSVISVVQTDLNAMAADGKAWTLPFSQTAAAGTADNVVFHLKNTSGDAFDIMRLIVSSAEAGLWTVATGRTYSSGGTAILLRQLNTASGRTQDLTAYYGTAITLAGTQSDIYYVRTAANTPLDLLDYGPMVIEQSDTVEIRFQGDGGGAKMAVTPILHGTNPWE